MNAEQEAIRFWSVTTLISEGTPNKALIGWAARTVAEAGVDGHAAVGAMLESGDRAGAIDYLKGARWRVQKQAAARGSQLHAIAEAAALGAPAPAHDPGIEPYVVQYRRFLEEHAPRYMAAEAPVYNLDYHYAGTLDSLAMIDDEGPYLLDIKTNYKMEGDEGARPPYPEIALQLVAYQRAQWVGLSPLAERKDSSTGARYYIYDPELEYAQMPEVAGALALVIFPDSYTLRPVRTDDAVWDAFLHVREVARWSLATSRQVIGPEISASVREAVPA